MEGMRAMTDAAKVVVDRPTRLPWNIASSAAMDPAFGTATSTRFLIRRAPDQVTGPPGEGSAPP